MLILGSLSSLILLVLLAILACVCCNRNKSTCKLETLLSGTSARDSTSLHQKTVGKSLYLTSDIKTVPSDEADALNRQFMLLKRCSRVKTTSTNSSSATSTLTSTGKRATSSLGEAQKPISNTTNTELRMPTRRSHRPESTVKIIEVTSSLEERHKKRKMPKR